KLLVFKKQNASSSLSLIPVADKRAANMVGVTWKAVLRRVLQGKTLSLDAIYQQIAPYAKHRQNEHWQAKVRQVLQDERYFVRVDSGVYTLTE
ncbi:DNA adenine modification methylase, partial [Vibrio parahaemolyticus]|nr:DNA adenine modification methylase [Vibrio parahaemolyticus]